ncbi:Organic hydroperoxide reductase OsmC/OhrA [Quadrisphaera granulorum]|uniref:Organic hydroperoxide reductase OsmC/OhrA n=1 Tax=Quadrisphaera granulorum TaxID=317664 RepID=A0A315ZQQ6_9ACTN|nr:OsmC family protein [Quadrisphaera granulorum]PWJ47612.1 organic hydroperoxide reductase OsmC/OhrA [Quadrisphaera granulorum]SZE98742.1 Organic hydroperoxide reductase OsmC/OhrA [Quadrisphaera granulorum]
MTTHTYNSTLTWSGTTTDYDTYNRRHEVTLAATAMSLSADAAFHGDPDLPNPEQLLVAAASSCQMLSFLAVAARSGITVVGYQDHADAVMPEDQKPMRLTTMTLRPHVTATATTTARVERALHKAHQQCYIANTLTCEVLLEPTIEIL